MTDTTPPPDEPKPLTITRFETNDDRIVERRDDGSWSVRLDEPFITARSVVHETEVAVLLMRVAAEAHPSTAAIEMARRLHVGLQARGDLILAEREVDEARTLLGTLEALHSEIEEMKDPNRVAMRALGGNSDYRLILSDLIGHLTRWIGEAELRVIEPLRKQIRESEGDPLDPREGQMGGPA